jgi:hypothetical protein
MEHELGHSDFGIDYAKLAASPKTPKTKSILKKRIPQESPRGDRFIPNRSAMDMEISHFNLMKENTNPNTYDGLLDSPAKEQYKAKIAESLFQESAGQLTNDAKVRSSSIAKILDAQRFYYFFLYFGLGFGIQSKGSNSKRQRQHPQGSLQF